ncbi:MAG: hypothetical protein CG439_991 [Methylococcaceae bacterium NSP1-2]|nr:MAG: hypothetical protein CG439_991 [Methylococcaceae bacterium NSP1-2]
MLMNRKAAELRTQIMNIIDLRKKLQQSSTDRCVSDRRKVSYLFGSPEWLEYMKNNKLEYSTEERRKIIRRYEDREQLTEPEALDSEANYKRIFLTAGERKLLQDIYLSDLD